MAQNVRRTPQQVTERNARTGSDSFLYEGSNGVVQTGSIRPRG